MLGCNCCAQEELPTTCPDCCSSGGNVFVTIAGIDGEQCCAIANGTFELPTTEFECFWKLEGDACPDVGSLVVQAEITVVGDECQLTVSVITTNFLTTLFQGTTSWDSTETDCCDLVDEPLSITFDNNDCDTDGATMTVTFAC